MGLPEELKSGGLRDLPFPRLLARIFQARLTGTLELRRGDVVKRVFFEGGDPVQAESTNPTETLSRFLVAEKILTEEQEREFLTRAGETGRPLVALLVEQKLVEGARLAEVCRKNLAQKLLDCFGWDEGTFALKEESVPLEHLIPLRMSVPSLLFRGAEHHYPPARMIRDGLVAGAKYRFSNLSTEELDALSLAEDEIKLLKLLGRGASCEELASKAEIPVALCAARLYVFRLLGLIVAAEAGKEEVSLDELVGRTLLDTLHPKPPPPPVTKADPEMLRLANEIASDHLRLMGLNYFDLLGCAESATAVEIRNKFMTFAVRFSPSRFHSPALGEFREQGEEIFLRGVKAFGTLSDFESKTKYIDKLKAERKKTEGVGKKKAGESFKIQTSLLSADSQFEKALRFLRDKKYDKALEFFQYCADVDANEASYQAHIAWTTYLMNPERNVKAAEEILRKAVDLKPPSAFAFYFLGKLLSATERREEAHSHLKKAAELDPKNIEIIREVRTAERTKK